MNLKNPYALFENKIISIYDLDESYRGLKCNCICPNCKAPFEAKMGDVRQWHFAHTGVPCDSVKLYVNACYLLAKQILLEEGIFSYPGLTYKKNQLFDAGEITINSIEIRYNRDELATGLIINNKDLAIRLLLDIDYCVDEIKLPLEGLSTLLIDFRKIQRANTNVITTRLCKELFGKNWIYSIAQKRYSDSFKATDRRYNIDVSDTEQKYSASLKEYKQPEVNCKICQKIVHKEDAMWARNRHCYICHKCIEENNINWREM